MGSVHRLLRLARPLLVLRSLLLRVLVLLLGAHTGVHRLLLILILSRINLLRILWVLLLLLLLGIHPI